MSSCRAAVFNGDGTYEIRDFALPTPGPGGGGLKCLSRRLFLHPRRRPPS